MSCPNRKTVLYKTSTGLPALPDMLRIVAGPLPTPDDPDFSVIAYDVDPNAAVSFTQIRIPLGVKS